MTAWWEIWNHLLALVLVGAAGFALSKQLQGWGAVVARLLVVVLLAGALLLLVFTVPFEPFIFTTAAAFVAGYSLSMNRGARGPAGIAAAAVAILVLLVATNYEDWVPVVAAGAPLVLAIALSAVWVGWGIVANVRSDGWRGLVREPREQPRGEAPRKEEVAPPET